jgi:glycosyltransferase involved in cell wall biosynthesis
MAVCRHGDEKGEAMRILVASQHRYPASAGGLAGCRVLDYLVKGLAELGHEVFYYLEQGTAVPLLAPVTVVKEPLLDVDIIHVQVDDIAPVARSGIPWVRTCHVDMQIKGLSRHLAKDNWIFVSRTLAKSYGSDRYVHNGIDPEDFLYAATKEDYCLFVCGLDRALSKGLETALGLSQKLGFALVVAGSSWEPQVIERITRLCKTYGAVYVGEAYGARLAKLFAGAKALLFPTQWNEAFGLVMVEALMSGTPVICSDRGACPELISPDVGFVCATEQDYLNAFACLDTIAPQACRDKAMRDYHYRRMAIDYVKEYEKELLAIGK